MPGTELDPGEDPPPPLEWFLFVGFDPGKLEPLPFERVVLGFVEPPGVVVPVLGGSVVGWVPGVFDGGTEPPLCPPDPPPDPPPEPFEPRPGGVVVPGCVVGGAGGAVVGVVVGDFAGGVEPPGECVLVPTDPPPPGDFPGEVVC
ncbi:MAG: hypothetical protein ACYCTE_10615, partial [Acidimicrobiales bacterium]